MRKLTLAEWVEVAELVAASALALSRRHGMLGGPADRKCNMKRYALITALGLLGATAWAGTFELSDPANEMYEEQQEREEELARIKEESAEAWAEEAAEYDAAVAASAAGNILCTVDTKTGACTCIDKEQARKLSLTQEECAARVLQAVQGGNP